MEAKQDFLEGTRRVPTVYKAQKFLTKIMVKALNKAYKWYNKNFMSPDIALKNDGPIHDIGTLEGTFDEQAMMRVTQELEDRGILCSVQKVDEIGKPIEDQKKHYVQEHQRKLTRKLMRLEKKAQKHPQKIAEYRKEALTITLKAKMSANRMQQAADLTNGFGPVGKLLQQSANRKKSRVEPDKNANYVISTNITKIREANAITQTVMSKTPLLKSTQGVHEEPDIIHIPESDQELISRQKLTPEFMREHPDLSYGNEKKMNFDGVVSYRLEADHYVSQRDQLMELGIMHTARVAENNQVEIEVSLDQKTKVEQILNVDNGIIRGMTDNRWAYRKKTGSVRIMEIEPVATDRSLDKSLLNDICQSLYNRGIRFHVQTDRNGEYKNLAYDAKESGTVTGVIAAAVQKKKDSMAGSTHYDMELETELQDTKESGVSKRNPEMSDFGDRDMSRMIQILSVPAAGRNGDAKEEIPDLSDIRIPVDMEISDMEM